MECKAIQYSDQMVCDRCQLKWDVNDIDPPKCEPFGVIDGDEELACGNQGT